MAASESTEDFYQEYSVLLHRPPIIYVHIFIQYIREPYQENGFVRLGKPHLCADSRFRRLSELYATLVEPQNASEDAPICRALTACLVFTGFATGTRGDCLLNQQRDSLLSSCSNRASSIDHSSFSFPGTALVVLFFYMGFAYDIDEGIMLGMFALGCWLYGEHFIYMRIRAIFMKLYTIDWKTIATESFPGLVTYIRKTGCFQPISIDAVDVVDEAAAEVGTEQQHPPSYKDITKGPPPYKEVVKNPPSYPEALKMMKTATVIEMDPTGELNQQQTNPQEPPTPTVRPPSSGDDSR